MTSNLHGFRSKCAPKALLGAFLSALLFSGCGPTTPETASGQLTARYRVTATRGVGAANKPYTVYLFPPIHISKSGKPTESMIPVKDGSGGLIAWRAPSSKSAPLQKWVKDSFGRAGYKTISFKSLLETQKPYSVMVVSTFYSSPSELEGAIEGGPNQTVTVTVKGVLFDTDLEPSTSRAVGNVLCTGFYSSHEIDAATFTGKLMSEAVRSLGDDFKGFGQF